MKMHVVVFVTQTFVCVCELFYKYSSEVGLTSGFYIIDQPAV